MQILKRDNTVEDFNIKKIKNAITKAMSETEVGIDMEVVNKIATSIEQKYSLLGVVPTVEQIQDNVEQLLAENGRFDVAKTYILYRQKRTEERIKGWELSELQKDIYTKKYKVKDETFDEFLNRISKPYPKIKKSIRDKKFLPAGRILAGIGVKEHGKSVTLSNCYVLPKVEDSLESIFDTAKELARTYSYGGGVGLNISNLRPNGALVQNSAHSTTGAVSFMNLYSMVTGLIGQRGRRGALMLNMDVNHPDILEFIDVKNSDTEMVRFANISININDEFMKAVENESDYELTFTVKATGEKITKTVNAFDLFMKLAKNNWNMAEPGILFQDRINNWHLMSEDETFEFASVNPCAIGNLWLM